MKAIFKLIKPEHWIKNLLIFAPLIFSKSFFDQKLLTESFYSFFVFCILSSTIYIFNDICDHKSDKKNKFRLPSKPIANGEITLNNAKIILIIFLIISLLMLGLKPKILFIGLIFLVLNFLYSILLKKIFIIDIFAISISYLIRVYAGGIVISVPISAWMLITVLTTAIFVVSMKRKKESEIVGYSSRKVLKKFDNELSNFFIFVSSSLSIAFYSIYTILGPHEKLYLTIPLVIFIFFRYFYFTFNLKKDMSPVEIFFSDKFLLLSVLIWGIASILLLYF